MSIQSVERLFIANEASDHYLFFHRMRSISREEVLFLHGVSGSVTTENYKALHF